MGSNPVSFWCRIKLNSPVPIRTERIYVFKAKTSYIKLNICAGSAKPAPPISVCLGQKRLFCKKFNELLQIEANQNHYVLKFS